MHKSRAQNIILSTGKFDHEKEYWLKKLSGELEGIHFPYDYPNSLEQRNQRNQSKFTLSLENTRSLLSLSNGSDQRLYMALLAIVKILLFRYTREEESIIISPIERQDLKGDYLNTLLFLRDQLQGTLNFRQVLGKVRETVIEAQMHQNYPYNLLLDYLHFSTEDLFQVGVVFNNLQDESLLRDQLPVIVFHFTLIANSITCIIDYHTGYYSSSTIEQLINHWQKIASTVLREPSRKIAQIELLTTEEQHKILYEFNDNPLSYSRKQTVVQLFEATAKHLAQKPAVEIANTSLTYCELNAKANQLAHKLIKLGVKPDSLVGVLLEPSLEIMIAILGILKASGAYLPLDPTYPTERIKYMLTDANVKILITTSSLAKRIEDSSEQILFIDQWEDFLTEESTNLDLTIPLDNLAYCIYTSGSTGQPKGVLIEHHSLLNLVYWHTNDVKITPKDRFGKYASFSFDASIVEIFPYITAGATLVMVPQEFRSDLVRLAHWYTEKQITATFLPTNLCEIMGKEFPHLPLGHMITGGDKLKTFLLTDYPIINCYGPTENTVVSTVSRVGAAQNTPHLLNQEKIIPSIGKPVPNTQVYILDQHLNSVPLNVSGEIYLAGEHIARGYVHNPELTNQSFINNPFTPTSRMYKSGDLGKWKADGSIEFLGRIDQQVKIRGFRIELGEIETKLLSHPAIQAAIVLPQPDEDGESQLVGYLLLREKIKVSGLRQYLKETLPEYMIPSAFIALEQLPLTANGKIDRKALPELKKAHLLTDNKYIAPRTELELTLAKIWEEVLRVEQVGIYDNFFELGGHSLKATQVISRIYKEIGIQIPVRIFFQAPNIATLAEKVKLADKGVYTAIKAQSPQKYYPLTHAQKRLWILDQMSEGNIAYNMPAAFLLHGPLHLDAFQRAFQSIIDRHEILRTRFAEVDTEPVQIVEPNYRFHLEYKPTSVENLHEYILHELAKPFDLTQPGLIRASLTKLKDNKHLLITNMHHIISDGWSINILVQELAVLYNAYKKGEFSPLEPLPIQYRDYAVWQNETMHSGSLAEQEKYWLNHLQGNLSILRLPYDEIDPAMLKSTGASANLWLTPELTTSLRELAQKENTTLFTLITAVLKILLYKLTGKTDLIIGVSSAGRSHDQLERLIGFFVNTLVLRTNLEGDPDFLSLLNQLRENIVLMYDHQDYPYDKLMDQLEKRENYFGGDLFTIMLNYLTKNENNSTTLADLEVESVPHQAEEAKFDLSLYVSETLDQVIIQVLYRTRLFKAETIRNWLDYLLNILTTISEKPELRLSEIQLITEEQFSSIINDFNEDL